MDQPVCLPSKSRSQMKLEVARGYLQSVVHLGEGLLGLLKKSKHDGPAELALVFVVIHLQDLLKCHGIDAIAQVRQADGALLALLLSASVSAPQGTCTILLAGGAAEGRKAAPQLRGREGRGARLTLSSGSCRVAVVVDSGMVERSRSQEGDPWSRAVKPKERGRKGWMDGMYVL